MYEMFALEKKPFAFRECQKKIVSKIILFRVPQRYKMATSPLDVLVNTGDVISILAGPPDSEKLLQETTSDRIL